MMNFVPRAKAKPRSSENENEERVGPPDPDANTSGPLFPRLSKRPSVRGYITRSSCSFLSDHLPVRQRAPIIPFDVSARITICFGLGRNSFTAWRPSTVGGLSRKTVKPRAVA